MAAGWIDWGRQGLAREWVARPRTFREFMLGVVSAGIHRRGWLMWGFICGLVTLQAGWYDYLGVLIFVAALTVGALARRVFLQRFGPADDGPLAYISEEVQSATPPSEHADATPTSSQEWLSQHEWAVAALAVVGSIVRSIGLTLFLVHTTLVQREHALRFEESVLWLLYALGLFPVGETRPARLRHLAVAASFAVAGLVFTEWFGSVMPPVADKGTFAVFPWNALGKAAWVIALSVGHWMVAHLAGTGWMGVIGLRDFLWHVDTGAPSHRAAPGDDPSEEDAYVREIRQVLEWLQLQLGFWVVMYVEKNPHDPTPIDPEGRLYCIAAACASKVDEAALEGLPLAYAERQQNPDGTWREGNFRQVLRHKQSILTNNTRASTHHLPIANLAREALSEMAEVVLVRGDAEGVLAVDAPFRHAFWPVHRALVRMAAHTIARIKEADDAHEARRDKWAAIEARLQQASAESEREALELIAHWAAEFFHADQTVAARFVRGAADQVPAVAQYSAQGGEGTGRAVALILEADSRNAIVELAERLAPRPSRAEFIVRVDASGRERVSWEEQQTASRSVARLLLQNAGQTVGLLVVYARPRHFLPSRQAEFIDFARAAGAFLGRSVAAVKDQRQQITPALREYLALLPASAQEIAGKLKIAPETVVTYQWRLARILNMQRPHGMSNAQWGEQLRAELAEYYYTHLAGHTVARRLGARAGSAVSKLG